MAPEVARDDRLLPLADTRLTAAGSGPLGVTEVKNPVWTSLETSSVVKLDSELLIEDEFSVNAPRYLSTGHESEADTGAEFKKPMVMGRRHTDPPLRSALRCALFLTVSTQRAVSPIAS